jgi:hypothetical protein
MPWREINQKLESKKTNNPPFLSLLAFSHFLRRHHQHHTEPPSMTTNHLHAK